MTEAHVREEVLAALRAVAPEIHAAGLRADAPIRDQVEIDSMDALRFFLELHRRLGVDVPERDYASLASVDDAVAYLVPRLSAASRSPSDS